MKGIILAGGSGTRLHPITLGISKQLLPIFDKPMIYYSLSVLMLADIREILIISTHEDINSYKRLFGTGEQLGLSIKYEIQKNPNGLAEAFIIGEEFIGTDSVSLILGDNIFYGQGLSKILNNAKEKNEGGTIFAYHVPDPERFGVVEISKDKKIISIEEKPIKPKSNFAVTGLYFYNNKIVDIAKSTKPSKRGELEITSVNNTYLEENNLNVEILGRGFAWMDTGTHQSMLDASYYVSTVQKRQGLFIACLEEIAVNKKWIDKKVLKESILKMGSNDYSEYLKQIYSSVD
ncbi:glucose-1-phosphate thymidylyltransferase RfbA [Gammaproteobacteria bacterium]|nr:glucose-1-phosphate thymidylyltransferase RfbA [Gammaproteobacteria bacterium]